MVPKPMQEWDKRDRRNFQLNAKVVYTLQCSMDRNEYNRICQFKSTKEIWRLLEITHEGTNQVKESKINLLVHSYELFFMKANETIVEIITKFTDIVNGLKALGKTYKEFEKVMQILRSINLENKQQKGEDKRKKSIALKATTKEEEDIEEDEDLILITRKFNKFMKVQRFRERRFISRRDFSKNESSSHYDKKRWEEKRDLVCFKYKKPRYIKYDCPLYKIEAKNRKKKAMMATWSESEDESSKE